MKSKEKPSKTQAKKTALAELGARLRRLSGKNYCTVQELVLMTGMTRAKIMNLETVGLVIPTYRTFSDTRTQRPAVFYSTEEILKALIISDLKDAGFSLQKIRRAINNLQDSGLRFSSTTHLLTNGRSIQAAIDDKQVIDILRNNRQLFLLVSVEDQIEKVTRIA
jgi:DNA-binding transcriptional MerR regulator